MATLIQQSDPMAFDALVACGAAATRRVGRQKHYASAMRLDRSRASRATKGDPHSFASRTLLGFRALAADSKTTPWPLIAESIAVVNQQQIERATRAELEAELARLDDMEDLREAEENRTGRRVAASQLRCPTDLEESAEADVAEAELQLKRAAIKRQLALLARKGL